MTRDVAYRLLVKRGAERDLRRLSPDVFRRVNAAILSLAQNPRPAGTQRLVGDLTGWRIRVGDYRVLYQINDEAREVVIVRVRHRRDVYRP